MIQRGLGFLSLVVVLVALYMAFVYTPPDSFQGDVMRVFYFHVAAAWNAYLAFFVVFLSSIAFLVSKKELYDQLAVSSAEIGVLFTSITLVMGSTWSRAIWGAWWVWEPRLTTTLILWFIYVAYLLIRASIETREKGARFAAMFAIVGFVDVPIVHMSVSWWRSVHPTVINTGGTMAMADVMLRTMLIAVVGFSLLYVYLVLFRYRTQVLTDTLIKFKNLMREVRL